MKEKKLNVIENWLKRRVDFKNISSYTVRGSATGDALFGKLYYFKPPEKFKKIGNKKCLGYVPFKYSKEQINADFGEPISFHDSMLGTFESNVTILSEVFYKQIDYRFLLSGRNMGIDDQKMDNHTLYCVIPLIMWKYAKPL